MTPTQPDGPGPKDWLSILALGVIWGSSFLSAKIALDGLGPLTLAAARVTLGGLILLLVMRIGGQVLPSGRRALAAVASFAVFSHALPFFLLNWAQQTVPSSFAGVSMAAVPLFVLPLAVLLVPGERFGWIKLLGLVLGFLGVVILIGPDKVLSGPDAALPRLACVAAALCYAIGGITTRLAPPMDQIGFSAAALTGAAILTIPGALLIEGPPALPDTRTLAATIYLAAGPTAIAALILVRTVRAAGPTFLSLVNYMVPVWAIVLGAIILSEPLPGSFLIAGALILTGVALSQWNALRRLWTTP